MNTQYTRVIPRDLFNESKLLKCVGRLVLLIHDRQTPEGLTFEHDDEPFQIGLWDEGALSVRNIVFKIGRRRLLFKTTYNAKSNYPLYCEHEYCEILVFDEDGQLSEEFKDLCKTLNPAKSIQP